MAKKDALLTEAISNICNLNLRVITLPPTITYKLYQIFDMAMATLESISDKPITIHICNSGGDVETALAIVGRIDLSPCLINTVALGKVYSAALYVYLAGEYRSAHHMAMFMHHEHSVGVDNSTLGAMKSDLHQMRSNYKIICEWIARKSKKPVKFWQKKGTKGKDFYFGPIDAVTLGICEEIF